MSQSAGIIFRPSQVVPLERIANLTMDIFRQEVITRVSKGERLVALFGHLADQLEIHAILADRKMGTLRAFRSLLLEDQYPSITPECHQAHLFERELAEQWGVVPKGHPWLKPVRFHSSYRPGHDAWGRTDAPTIGVMDFYHVEGEEVHEVAVGPVHAGIIEPGHFRFQCHGEQVFHLEISLGYQHRGVERSLIGGPDKRTLHTVETLAGDTTIGHATAYCQLLEALSGRQVPIRAEVLRGIALELERLANHTGDLGALAGDVGFLPTASYCGRLRGDFLNLSALLCGNRFGRGLVRPGGVAFDLGEKEKQECLERLEHAVKDVENAVGLLWNTPSVQARFEETGPLDPEMCVELGMTGPAARACGKEIDSRQDFPTGIYRFSQIPVSTWPTGDVFARAYVRWLEIQRSAVFIKEQLLALPEGELKVELSPLRPDCLAVVLVEGWRGEICHAVITNPEGKIARYKVVDPSFHNWTGLALALRGQQISDFPLCNKSFNLSYCGTDL